MGIYSAKYGGAYDALRTVVEWLERSTDWMFVVAFALMLSVGGFAIHRLATTKWRDDAESWMERENTPDTHRAKRGTPSMGGLIIVGAAVVVWFSVMVGAAVAFAMYDPYGYSPYGNMSWLAAAWFHWSLVWGTISPAFSTIAIVVALLLLPFATVAHAGLGFADDWSKATGRGGLRARSKFAVQLLLAGSFVAVWYWLNLDQAAATNPFLPLSSATGGTPGSFWPSLLLLAVLIVGTCNAANLTDGIDGLAAGLAVQGGIALLHAIDFYTWYQADYFPWGEFPFNLFWAALAGSCLGFLFFNKHPAKVFMGDTGSLAIGAALAVGAILVHAVALLPFIGFIFYVEMFSVMIQVGVFKYAKSRTGEGRRIFRRAPLHHHFELCGWSEWRVVGVFWIINLVTTVVGLVLWNMGLLPRWP